MLSASHGTSGGGTGDLGQISLRLRDGDEPFHDHGRALGFDVLGFWRWSTSDVVNNTTRGILAEYLVAQAVDVSHGVRVGWAAYDIDDPRGIAIEVKSAAYVQSWSQRRLSPITFGCARTCPVDPLTQKPGTVKCRQAQVYVFALLAHQDQETLDPLDVSQWEFYVVPTAVLDCRERSQHSITLKSLRDLHGPPVDYSGLPVAIAEAARDHKDAMGTGQHDLGGDGIRR